ncbi:hypothetical protein WMY93_032845 [Mugilogobius chulae]|uniref:Uncharacterized protein n=1 Tax=Mugilogobius chulae TaxID=88201 RepID=A0AAW0MMF9_9GOBI
MNQSEKHTSVQLFSNNLSTKQNQVNTRSDLWRGEAAGGGEDELRVHVPSGGDLEMTQNPEPKTQDPAGPRSQDPVWSDLRTPHMWTEKSGPAQTEAQEEKDIIP